MTELLTTISAMAIHPAHSHPVYGEYTTHITMTDEAAGPFFELTQNDKTISVTVEELRALLGTLGVTGVLVTHDQAEALEVADTVAVMRDGTVEQQGTPIEVYLRPATVWAATFLGEVVLMEASAAGSLAHTPLGEVPVAPDRTGPVTVMLRPEQLVLTGCGGTPARVERVRYGGHDALVELRLGDGRQVLGRVQAGEIPTAGDDVVIRVRGVGIAYPPEPPL